MPDNVLITTHDLDPAVKLRDAFEAAGFEVELLTATEHISDVKEPVLLIVTGSLEEKRVRRLLREAHERDRLPVIALVDTPVEAAPESRARYDVSEAFVKPIDVAEVVLVGRRLIDRKRLREVTGIVGETSSMDEVLEIVVQIAPVNSTVLVTGESGTGKELVARGLHALSPRKHRPFIAANVAAMPESLVESEIFGHEKGAFTGAISQRKGFFELANRGTLFLDEISEMPLSTQSKLLRVLETREFMRVGGEEPIHVDVRVIAATNQDLRQLVEIGQFRRDLYYRLNVLHVRLPALRERREDVPLLVQSFIQRAAAEHDRPAVIISPAAMDLLMAYAWPGNVRELKNLVESMVVLSPSHIIGPEDIPEAMRVGGERNLLPATIQVRRNDGSSPPAELEFIFRTLVQLRMDVEDLRQHFDDFRRTHPDAVAPVGMVPTLTSLPHGYAYPAPGTRIVGPIPIEDAVVHEDDEAADDDDGLVVFRRGMSMDDLEREAITAILKEVRGNRRKAAELLGIGERTLYRKIKEYGIPL
jgi:DNA-binding NtrC family response regulator